ncbi:MAG: DNA-processing protein DprA [Spirochaetota bacterium]
MDTRTAITQVTRLAIGRLTFLRAAEKHRLAVALGGGADFASLGFSELELIVGRLLRTRVWNPAAVLEAAGRDEELLASRDIRLVHVEDPEYPPLLREIHDPPWALFVRGARLDHAMPVIAIVGTRSSTGLGEGTARDFASRAALAGLPVVSGLARGIDAAAHRGALAARKRDASAGPTIAVLPVGIDSVYPPSNRGLAAAILESGGCLVSEYPPGDTALTFRFPERNRVIAGIARGTLVVEAPSGSGALITSGHALDAGRDVFVARTLLGGPMNAGADRLAAEGAQALGDAGELLAEWGLGSLAGEAPGSADEGSVSRRFGEDDFLAASLRSELGLDLGARSLNPGTGSGTTVEKTDCRGRSGGTFRG